MVSEKYEFELVSNNLNIHLNRIFLGVIGAEMARNEHFQRLDEYQGAEVLKRKNEIRAIDREMNKIDKRIRTKWE